MFYDLLKCGCISKNIKTNQIKNINFINISISSEDCDKKLHRDIEADDINFHRFMFDVKHKSLPTKYKNYSINRSCIEFIRCRYKNNFNDYKNYFYAFVLDDGINYLEKFLIVSGYDIMNLVLSDKAEFKSKNKKLKLENNLEIDDGYYLFS